MTLAPIRGAPPDAPIPDFPIGEARAAQPAALPAEPAQQPVQRQRGTPIEIGGDEGTLSFRVDPELPAIRRASMTIHVVPTASDFLRMSASRARQFLTDLRNGRSPLVATGDEGGTVEISYETTETGAVLSVRKPGEPALLRCTIDRASDMQLAADELLADLGA